MIQQFINAFNNYKGNNKTTDKITFQPYISIWRENDNQIKVLEIKVKQMGIVSIVVSTSLNDEDKATIPVGTLSEKEQELILDKLKMNEVN